MHLHLYSKRVEVNIGNEFSVYKHKITIGTMAVYMSNATGMDEVFTRIT